jgi:hypothetical protein
LFVGLSEGVDVGEKVGVTELSWFTMVGITVGTRDGCEVGVSVGKCVAGECVAAARTTTDSAGFTALLEEEAAVKVSRLDGTCVGAAEGGALGTRVGKWVPDPWHCPANIVLWNSRRLLHDFVTPQVMV